MFQGDCWPGEWLYARHHPGLELNFLRVCGRKRIGLPENVKHVRKCLFPRLCSARSVSKNLFRHVCFQERVPTCLFPRTCSEMSVSKAVFLHVCFQGCVPTCLFASLCPDMSVSKAVFRHVSIQERLPTRLLVSSHIWFVPSFQAKPCRREKERQMLLELVPKPVLADMGSSSDSRGFGDSYLL